MHNAERWSEFVLTMLIFGYDFELSIEYENSLTAPEEGLMRVATFINNVIIRETTAAAKNNSRGSREK